MGNSFRQTIGGIFARKEMKPETGALKVEKLQFDDIHTLVNALSFYSVVAWYLMSLNYTLSENPSQQATEIFTKEDLAILQPMVSGKISTVAHGVLALGKIVGFAPSKKQPFPGLKTLGIALERFFFMKMGARAYQQSLES